MFTHSMTAPSFLRCYNIKTFLEDLFTPIKKKISFFPVKTTIQFRRALSISIARNFSFMLQLWNLCLRCSWGYKLQWRIPNKDCVITIISHFLFKNWQGSSKYNEVTSADFSVFFTYIIALQAIKAWVILNVSSDCTEASTMPGTPDLPIFICTCD